MSTKNKVSERPMDFRRELRRNYFGRFLRLLLSPVGSFEWSAVFRKDLNEPIAPFPASIPIEIVEACETDLAEVSRATPYHLIDLLKSRYRTGSKCLLAKIDGKIVGFNWYVYGPAFDEDYRIQLVKGDIYCMDAMTYEPYRGLSIHTELLSRLLSDARREGFSRAYTRASVMNVSSWKTHLRLGWQYERSTFLLHFRTGLGGKSVSWPKVYPLQYARSER